MKNRKRWTIPVALLAVIAAVAALFGQTLLLYIAPKMVLAGALKERVAQLESRISSSPISVLARGIDAQGRNRIDLQLQTHNELIGTLSYDMDLQMEQHPKRILADGRVTIQNKEMDLSVYLDSDFAAVSSDGLLGGNFYGLTYDSFSQDILSNKWLSLLIGNSVLRTWDSKIESLQKAMQQKSIGSRGNGLPETFCGGFQPFPFPYGNPSGLMIPLRHADFTAAQLLKGRVDRHYDRKLFHEIYNPCY